MTSSGWAQLVSTTDNISDPVVITKDKFIIGRAKSADLCIIGNKMVSGTHCFIEKDDSGQVWLQDTSTNGTLLNLSKKIIGSKEKLEHGDEIHLVYRKNEPDINVAYLYQDLVILAQEEADATQEYSSEADPTTESEKTDPIEQDIEFVEAKPVKRPSGMECTFPPAKRRKEDTEESIEGAKNKKSNEKSEPDSLDKTKEEKSKRATELEKDAIGENLICIICQEILHDCISLQPCMHTFCAGCFSDWMVRSHECPTCRKKVERVNKNHIVNNLVEAYLKSHPEKCRPQEELRELDAKNKIKNDLKSLPSITVGFDSYEDEEEDMEDDGSGVSDSDDGAELSQSTPALFPTVGNIVLPPKTVCRQCPEYKEPSTTGPTGNINQPAPTGIISQAVAAGSLLVNKVVNLVAGGGDAGGQNTDPQPGPSRTPGPTVAGEPSTSTGITAGKQNFPPPYVCRPTEIHLLCQCCLQPMPNRKANRDNDPRIPPQSCPLCYGHYCHAYWGCRKAGCDGCLGQFKELHFTDKCMNLIIMENTYESDVLKNYLDQKAITVDQFHQICCEKLDSGEYSCQDNAHLGNPLKSDFYMCYRCGMRIFRELAYQYRRNIPNEDIPVAVTSRSDCHWGKNCRTQKCKPHHAIRFNHVCEQTRF